MLVEYPALKLLAALMWSGGFGFWYTSKLFIGWKVGVSDVFFFVKDTPTPLEGCFPTRNDTVVNKIGANEEPQNYPFWTHLLMGGG